MKHCLLILLFFISTKVLVAQVIFRPLSYSVDDYFDYPYGMRYTCDGQGWIQNELVFFQNYWESTDTIILFRASMYNNCLKGTPRWYNEDGDVIGKIETSEGGCDVHASSHYFIMPGNVRMSLSALISQSDYWFENQPAVKRMEEFYSEGYLEKRIMYFENGFRQSEVSYIYDQSIPSFSNSYQENYREFGPAIYYYDNGVKESEGNRDGSLNTGTWTYYDLKGRLTKEIINHNRDSITTVYYHSSGKIESIFTKYNSTYVGEQKSFYETSALKSYTHYNNTGEQDTARITYHPNGKMMSYTPCCGDCPVGIYTSWHDNGIKYEEVQLEDCFRVGQYNEWYPNGKLRTKGKYGNYETKIGVWYFYNEKGLKDSSKNYDIDVEIVEMADMVDWISVDVDDRPNQYSKNFEHRLPSIHFLNSSYGTYMEVTKENRFEVIEKYSKILVQINVDPRGGASYWIRTPMKEKHRQVLDDFFKENRAFDSPFWLMNKTVHCTIMMEIEFLADE